MAIVQFFKNIKDAAYGFAPIRDWLVDFYYSLTANPEMEKIWGGIMKMMKPHFAMYCMILATACIVIAFFGKKMMGLLRYILFFVVGFAIGMQLLAPLIPDPIRIPGWIIGILIAIVTSVLSRFLYYGTYALTIFYSMYVLCYQGFYIKLFGNAIVSLIVALVIVVLAFIFKRFVEMVMTAAFGGWFASVLISNFVYDFAAWPIFCGIGWIGKVLFAVIVGVLGFIVQIKTRRRY